MSNPSRFRMYRGRVDGADTANLHTLGKVSASAVTSYDLSSSAEGLILDTLSLDNSAASHVFVGGRFPNDAWKMWRWDESKANGTEVASGGNGGDITTAMQGTSANQEISTLDANDGWVIGASRKFSTIIISVDQVTNGEVTDEFSYWNGSSWTALTQSDFICIKDAGGTKPAQGGNLTLNDENVPVGSTNLWANTAETLIVFSMPLDWEKTTTSSTTTNVAQGGVDDGYYALRWRNTDDPNDAKNVVRADYVRVGCATRLVIWSLADITTGENLNIPMTSSDEIPWVVYEMAGTHKVSASVQVTSFNDTLGEGSKG